MEVDFENVWTLFRKGEYGIVAKLCAFVQFQLKRGNVNWKGNATAFDLIRAATYPLNVFAILSKINHALVGDAITAGNIESLQSLAIFSNGVDGLLSNVLVVGNVQG